jgi:release factor glutamine methyltransferase
VGKGLLKGHSDGGIEARVLLCKSASIEVERFFADRDKRLTRGEERRYLRLVARRRSGVPLSYLTNEKEFWSLIFNVYRGVLIPRPETELIVEKVVEFATNGVNTKSEDGGEIKSKKSEKNIKSKKTGTSKIKNTLIADIGTGCGNIAIALAKELTAAQIVATDVSKTALKVARRNARKLGASRVIFPQGSLFTPLERFKLRGKCDYIVSNPPYVSQDEWETLQPQVRDFEPKRALVAGKTGLEFIRKLVKGAPAYLKPGGYLVFEIGHGQKEDVLRLSNRSDIWSSVQCFDDLSAIPRVVVAQM